MNFFYFPHYNFGQAMYYLIVLNFEIMSYSPSKARTWPMWDKLLHQDLCKNKAACFNVMRSATVYPKV